MPPGWLSTLGFAMGSAWLSGINLYATVLTLGLLQHFGLARLPGDLGFVGQWWVIGVAGLLYLVEFVADKVPAVDSVWDAVHTFIRVPAGAIMAASAFADFDPSVRVLALLLGGGVALSSHGTKASARLAANTSPEPFSNIALSLMEDLIAVVGAIVAAFHPIVLLIVVAVFLVIAAWIARRICRGLRALLRRKVGSRSIVG
jgi:uncharacterized membrane protein